MSQHRDADVLEAARQVVAAEMKALNALQSQIDERVLAAARLISRSTGKVLTAGLGTSGYVARRMAHLLSVTGTPAVFIHPADALHGGLGVVRPDDVLIAISKGGQSQELNEFTRRARSLGARCIVLTAVADSELARLGDLTVVLEIPEDADPGGIVAMGSTLVTSAWGDALAHALMLMREYTWQSVLFTHPHGAVGRRGISNTNGEGQ